MSISTAIYLLEIDAWTGAGVETLRLATRSFATGPLDTPPNAAYLGRIVDAGKISCEISIKGETSTSFGALILNNQDGALDGWFDYGFDGREFRLKELPSAGVLVASAKLLFRGVVDGIDGSDALKTLRVKVRDSLAVLERPFLTARYAGTTTTAIKEAEGNQSVGGQIKPRVYGAVRNMVPVRVNDAYLIDQWSDGPVQDIKVYDGMVALVRDADYPSLSSLIDAAVPAGSFATCNALGLSRLGFGATFTITGDVVEGDTRSAARVAQRVLANFGVSTVDAASFDALHALCPGDIGILINDNTSARDVLSEVLKSAGARLVARLDGTFRAVAVADPRPKTPVATFTQRDIGDGVSFSIGTGVISDDAIPTWSYVLNFGKVWRTMSAADVAGAVTQAVKDDIALEYRQAAAQDATVKTAHLQAGEATEDTLMTMRPDAMAEAQRRLDLNKVRRDALVLPLIDFAKGGREIGDVVSIRTDRFGQRGGKNVMVIGRSVDFQKRVVTLTAWG